MINLDLIESFSVSLWLTMTPTIGALLALDWSCRLMFITFEMLQRGASTVKDDVF